MLFRKTIIVFLLFSNFYPAFARENTLGPSAKFEIGFSPKKGSLGVIINGINQAKESIHVAAYAFTSKPVSLALLNAHKRGVKVFVIADKKANTSSYSAVQFLANHGVPVRLNGNYAIFHHKFMVIDKAHLQVGSFNYSSAANNKNAENVLLLMDVKPIASRYLQEWERLWVESIEIERSY